MRLSDIQQVATIDASCFEPPWSSDSYAFEIKESTVSHMVVLDRCPELPPPATQRQNGWLSQLSGLLRGHRGPSNGRGDIVGYGGLWKIEGEAHISTIATHPNCRGNGFGEILLAGMFGKALRLNADFIVLEVRVSNAVAQSLYQKYGFSRFGRRRNYYRSDNEDAWEMRVTLDVETRRRFIRLYDELVDKHDFRDTYSWKARSRR
ncbi:MAG: ribosomal protein S18-alanine N-acetyltransferase [Chloroflexi bacterium]|nr:ribosomal protein S18-alanine N-acetyltransferase [Chloroflexota bacterium]